MATGTTPAVGAGRARRSAAGRLEPCRRALPRTIKIALCVGVIVSALNQGDVILAGDATAFTAVKASVNFVVPFVVANLGVLSAERGPSRGSP